MALNGIIIMTFAACLANATPPSDVPNLSPFHTHQATIDSPARTAEAWLEGLLEDHVEDSIARSAIPFSWDARTIIIDGSELAAKYQRVADKLQSWKVSGIDHIQRLPKSQVRSACMPETQHAVVFRFSVGESTVDVCVDADDTAKAPLRVVGFSH